MNIKVKILKTIECGGLEYTFGEEYWVHRDVGLQWINAGYAELIDEPVQQAVKRPAKKAARRRTAAKT